MVKQQFVKDAKTLIGPSCEVTDDVLVDWANDALQLIYDEISDAIPDYFSKKVDTSSIATQAEYALPVDFRLMVGVWFAPESDGDYKRCNNWDRYAHNTPIPFTYYVRGQVFGFPVPPAKTGSHNIRLVYNFIPT
jgi:hypothetical protein